MLTHEKMKKYEEMLCKELDKIEDDVMQKRGMTEASLSAMQKITDTIKNLYKIEKLSSDDGFSGRGYSRDGNYWEAQGSYADGRSRSYGNQTTSYDDGGYSGRHYVRGHYSRDDAKSAMIERLENIMHNANERDKETIREAVATLQQM